MFKVDRAALVVEFGLHLCSSRGSNGGEDKTQCLCLHQYQERERGENRMWLFKTPRSYHFTFTLGHLFCQPECYHCVLPVFIVLCTSWFFLLCFSGANLFETLRELLACFAVFDFLCVCPLHTGVSLWLRLWATSTSTTARHVEANRRRKSGVLCVNVCMCVSQWKESARRMASTTSDTSSKQQWVQCKDLYNSKRLVSSVDHCHPYRRNGEASY